MEIREEIIQKIVDALDGRVNTETKDVVRDVLTIELNQYELQERFTEIAVQDDTAERIPKKYIATKRIEGVAESTIKRYSDS